MKAWLEGKKRVGPWKVRWRELVDGKVVKRASPSFGSLPEVQAEFEAVNLMLAKQNALKPKRRTTLLPIADVIGRWKGDALAAGTVGTFYADQVERTLTKLCAAQGWQFTNQITADAVATWRKAKPRGHTRPTANLKTLLRWARSVMKQPIDEDLLHLKVQKPTPRLAPSLLTPEQIEAIVTRAHTFGDQVGAAIEHQTLFGCRPADICRLNVGDWDPRTGMLTLQSTKSRTRPSHPIHGAFEEHARRLDALAAGRAPDAPLFLNPFGLRWQSDRDGSSRQMADWYWWHITLPLPEIPSTHRGISCLKDYAITLLDAAGVDDRTKTLFTGHRSLSVYARYKATNAARATEALAKLGAIARPSGGKFGGTLNLEGQKRGQTSKPAKPKTSTKHEIRREKHQA